MKIQVKFLVVCVILLALCPAAQAQGTAFTYQGRLNGGGGPANGGYDLTFTLYNTNNSGVVVAGPVTNSATVVANGLFTTLVDFGPGVFISGSNWLEIAVSTNGANSFTTLAPRQQVTPAPYAITAENLAGVVANNTIQYGVTLATISGGAGNLIQGGANDSTIGGGGANSIGGNSFFATIAGGGNNSIGTNDDTSTIAGGNANIIQDGAGVSTIAGGVGNEIQTGSPRSTISGGSGNQVLNNSEHSTIGGGGGNQIQDNSSYSVISGGWADTIYAQVCFIGGGYANQIQANSTGSAISGGQQNVIQLNDFDSTIGGGYYNQIQNYSFYSTIGGGYNNQIEANADDSTIGGGNGNAIQSGAFESFIGGGQGNGIGTNAVWSTIGGGLDNGGYGQFSTVSGGQGNMNNGMNATIGGGYQNTIQTNDNFSTIGGGVGNTIQTNSVDSTISGGGGNMIQSNAYASTVAGGYENNSCGTCSTVGGGYYNVACGDYSFAAGNQAQALNPGAFVWADSQSGAFASTASNQFLIRAGGGVGININNPNGASLYVQGNRSGGTFNSAVGFFENTSTATGSGGSGPALRVVCDGGSTPAGALSVSDNGTGPIAEFGNGLQFVASVENDGTIKSKGVALTSDRNAKENFTVLDGKSVLAKVISLPVTEWNYKDDAADKKHIGPVAQDFHAAFDLNGADDKHISVVDEGGVALAAIQGLNQKVEQLISELTRRDAENAELKVRLEKLEQLVTEENGGAK